MSKGLRKIAELAFCDGIVLFGNESNIISQGEQPFKQLLCLLRSADGMKAISQPEGAWQESTIAAWKTVDRLALQAVAQSQSVLRQFALVRVDRAAYPFIIRR